MKPFTNPPPIDPLDDLSWHRVERDLFEALETPIEMPVLEKVPPRNRVWLATAGALVAVAAVIALLVLWPDGERDNGESRLSRLVTNGSSSSMVIGDASISADPHTALWVADNGDRGVEIVLERGAIDCAVVKRPGRAPFRVIAGDVVVAVVGTKFRVARAGDSATVRVERGIVSVLAGGQLERLKAGEEWPQKTASRELGDSNSGAEPEPEPAPEPKPQPEPKTSPVTKQKPAPVKASAKERYRSAAKLESTDPGAALAIYKRLARSGGSWAAPSLFAQGRLEVELGKRARAKRTLLRYLAKYPRGLNAADARALLAQLNK